MPNKHTEKVKDQTNQQKQNDLFSTNHQRSNKNLIK